MLEKYYFGAAPGTGGEAMARAAYSEDFDPSSGTTDRGLGSPSSGSSSFGSVMKDIVQTAKANFDTAKTFVSLQARLSKELYDPSVFPEVAYQAVVRRGPGLGPEELAYLQARKAAARDNFARYMGWDPAHVHPDDVPTVAFGGSGGGYRAMLAVMGYSKAMKEVGLWPLLSYIAGVSGSCKLRVENRVDKMVLSRFNRLGHWRLLHLRRMQLGHGDRALQEAPLAAPSALAKRHPARLEHSPWRLPDARPPDPEAHQRVAHRTHGPVRCL